MLIFDAPIRQKNLRDRFANAFVDVGQNAPEEIINHLMGKKQREVTERSTKELGLPSGFTNFKDDISKEIVKNTFQERAKKSETQEKKQQEVLKKQEALQGFNNALDGLEKLKPYTGNKLLAPKQGYFTRESVEKRSEIDALGSIVAEQAYNTILNNKGALSEAKIEKLMRPYLIKSNDSERVYQGKLNALKGLVNRSQEGGLDERKIAEVENEFKQDTVEHNSNKIKFNPENPEHLKKYDQLFKKFNGNAQQINEVLAKEYTL